MGRRRPANTPEERRRQAEEEQSSPEAVAAAVAAVLLAGATVATVPAVAAALLPVLPAALLATPALAASVAEEAARLALTGPPKFRAEVGEWERRASLENLLLRGFYTIAAARRLSGALVGGGEGEAGERLGKALTAERRHLTAHQEARAKNLEAARKTDRARELFGDLVTWNHGARGMPAEPRPNHVAADGKVWDLRRGIPVSTGALPGVLPFCTCAWGPPRAGAERLI